MVTNHAPHTKNSRNIIADRFPRTVGDRVSSAFMSEPPPSTPAIAAECAAAGLGARRRARTYHKPGLPRPGRAGRALSGGEVPAGDNGHWKVVDGVIDYDALSEATGDKSLWTQKEYADFVLRLEGRDHETPAA